MQFENTPSQSITIPTGAGPGQARTVIGQDIPPELADFYLNSSNAPYILRVVSCVLNYPGLGDDSTYFYQAQLLAGVGGGGQPAMGFGIVSGGTVIPRLFLDSDGFANPLNISPDIIWSDPQSGNTFYGTPTPATYYNPWGTRPGSFAALSYTRLPLFDLVHVFGQVVASSAVGSGSAVANIPFHPATSQGFALGTVATAPQLGTLETNGDIKVWSGGTVATTLYFNNLISLR